jgi:hypothetical protein
MILKMKYKSFAGKSLQIVRSLEVENDPENEPATAVAAAIQLDYFALREAAKTGDVRRVCPLLDNGEVGVAIFEDFDNLLSPDHPILHSLSLAQIQ